MAAARNGGMFSGTSIGDFMKAGFGLTLGSFLASIIFMFLAVILFVPGFIMVTKQQKKPKDQRNTTVWITGYVLMGLGMILGLGFGAGAFFGTLGNDL